MNFMCKYRPVKKTISKATESSVMETAEISTAEFKKQTRSTVNRYRNNNSNYSTNANPNNNCIHKHGEKDNNSNSCIIGKDIKKKIKKENTMFHNTKENDSVSERTTTTTERASTTRSNKKHSGTIRINVEDLETLKIWKKSIKDTMAQPPNAQAKTNNNIVNDVNVGEKSNTTMILVVGTGGILCLVVATVFVCFWG